MQTRAQSNASGTLATGVVVGERDARSQHVRLDVDVDAKGTPLIHYWSKVVGAGRANEGLRASWQKQLHTAVQAGGFRYVRFHGLFHDDMFMYHNDQQGHPVYNFQYVDDLFDRMPVLSP